MQIYSTIVSFLLSSSALVAAVPVSKRDINTVLADLSQISSDVAAITSIAQTYDGDPFQSITLATQVQTLENDATKATSDTSSSQTFTESQAQQLLSSYTSLGPSIIALLNDFIAKASTFASAGLTSLVHDNLVTLQGETDSLFSATEAKVPSDDVSSFASLQTTIDNAFAQAIAAF
ncbi:hydrophobic surface binding protein A-domain-containing protein [Xylogone sp. PMI_703]|nr:hydrophobic surface binding protein A-domain-containing protein [Xylogone sp. PMI_703]